MDRRVAHELLALVWPWWLVILVASVAPLLKFVWAGADFSRLEAIAVIGFFGGATVLAASVFAPARRGWRLSSSARAAGPTGRWEHKGFALAAAVFVAAVVACLVQTLVGGVVLTGLKLHEVVEPVLLLVVLVCSAAGWASIVRSVVGAILLSGAAFGLLYLIIVAVVTGIDCMSPAAPGSVRLSHSPGVHTALICVMAALGLGYAVLMLRLGRRRFAAMEPSGLRTA